MKQAKKPVKKHKKSILAILAAILKPKAKKGK